MPKEKNTKTKNTPDIISTDANALISHCSVLAKLIVNHTRLITETLTDDQSNKPPFSLLSERQLDDALKGPFQAFFKQKISAYALIARVQLELSMNKEEAFKDSKPKVLTDNPLPESFIEETSNNLLNDLRKQLDELTTQHNQQWEAGWTDWVTTLIDALAASPTPLNEIEIQQLRQQEPRSELLERFSELNIDVPKAGKSGMTFATYLRLKTHLVLHSALARQHQPHEPNDIAKAMKSIKTVLDQVHKQEKKWLTEQQTQTDAVIEPIAVAKPK